MLFAEISGGKLDAVSREESPWRSADGSEVSDDDSSWTGIYTGVSSGTTLDLESHAFANQQARYLRIVGYGNSDNDWNSITEIQIFLSTP